MPGSRSTSNARRPAPGDKRMEPSKAPVVGSWEERESRALMYTYRRYPIVAVRGDGCRLWDVDGKEYLDFLGGLAVDSLGHAPRVVVEAVQKQAAQLIQTS